MKTITIANQSIDIQSQPVSLCFSGGADSALLLYILLANSSNLLHVYTFASQARQFRTAVNSSRVLVTCCELTGNHNVQHHIEYIDQQQPMTMWPRVRAMAQRDSVQCVYTAVTALPAWDQQQQFAGHLPQSVQQQRGADQTRPVYTNGGGTYSPFVNLNKQQIAEIYSQLELRQALWPVTNSCEGAQATVSDHCGACWWCSERAWAWARN